MVKYILWTFLVLMSASNVQEKTEQNSKKLLEDLSDSDPMVRSRAVKGLGEIDSMHHVKEIAKLLRDNDSNVRVACIQSLTMLEAKGYEKEIADLLKDDIDLVKPHAARYLAIIVAKEYRKEIANLLSYKNGCFAGDAIFALGMLGSHEYTKEFVALIDGSKAVSVGCKQAALLALGQLKAEEHMDLIAKSLDDQDEGTVLCACVSIGLLGGKKYADRLSMIFKTANGIAKPFAALAIGLLGSQNFSDEISNSLQENSTVLSSLYIQALALLNSKKHTKNIASFLKQDSSGLEIIGIFGEKYTHDSLNKGSVIWALGKLEAKEYTREILQFVDNTDRTLIFDADGNLFRSITLGKLAKQVLRDWSVDYVVVVSRETYKVWKEVVEALEKKHSGVTVVCSGGVGSAKKELANIFPRYVCFVARPEECGRQFVIDVHRLTRTLDDDPYTDCLWGIITGYDATDAIRIAQHAEPLKIRRAAAGCGIDLDLFSEGVWFSEGDKGVMYEKKNGGKAIKKSCPEDTTKLLIDELSQNKPQAFFTSGHASDHVWELGYSYKNGVFFCSDGRLFGQDTKGKQYEIRSDNPKVYNAQGNCLVGLVSGKNCMALAWMKGAGIYQMTGYAVSTWFGYMGWGINDYFLQQCGRFTFSESFFLANQTLIHRLESNFPKTSRANIDEFNIEIDKDLLNKLAKKHGITSQENLGLLWDRDTFAFYGDPAWQARIERVKDPLYEQTLEQKETPKGVEFTFSVKTLGKGQWGQRPPAAVLPFRISQTEVLKGKELKPLITDNFILLPIEGEFKQNQVYVVKFVAKKAG